MARKHLRRAGTVLRAGFCVLLAGASSLRGATTNINWIATSPADYNVPGDWDLGLVPGGSGAGTNYVALFTNNVACNFASPDNYWVGQMSLGPWNNSTGAFVLNGGALLVSNTLNDYAVTIGGRSGSGGSGAAALSPTSGANGVGSLTMNGGSLTVSRYGSGYYHQDSFILGLGTNSSGTLTLNGGTLTLLCGLEAGIYGSGTVNVHGGAVVDNGWFGIGRGNGSPYGSGTFNLTGGAVYILPNFSGGTVGGTGGLQLNQGCTNATVNISGGTLWVSDIGFNGGSYSPPPVDTLNLSGGAIYLGSAGVYANSSSATASVNISGGTFHTAHMLGVGAPGGVAANTNVDILDDGTNWTWAEPAVNLTNSSFAVNGVAGPGYVTFAPETGRTITLANVWNGSGGLTLNGPGTVAMGGSNTYSGNTTILQGTLALIGGGSLASSNIVVGAGAIFEGPGSGQAFTLGAGQTLSNSSSTAVLEGNLDTGPGTMALEYVSGTPAFTVMSGSLGLSTATPFTINNTGSALAQGSYEVIAAGSGGSVTVPGGLPAVTVTGGGVAAGQYADLSIVSNQLYLVVSTNRPPVIANVVTNNIYYGSTWQIAISNLAALAGWSDPSGKPLSLSSVGPLSANGISVTTDGTNIYYNGSLTSSDSFDYSITDGTLATTGGVYLSALNPTAAIPADTNYVVSLDSTWRFYFERTNYNFGTVPDIVLPPDSQAFQNTNYTEGPGWTNLAVPGNWEMAGFSPCTYYVPDDTCGLYRDWFTVPASWQGRRVYLWLDGVLDGAEVWLNGQPVPVNESSWNISNYHESAWTAFQVDLTAQAQFGTTNLLAIRVIKSTPSDDLDTGDYFVMGGIHRSVTLYSVPQTNIADVQISTSLLAGNSAQVSVVADVNFGNASTPVAMILNGVETDTTATNGTAVFNQVISQPALWSAEFPNLYPLRLELKNSSGQVTETVTNRFGIRQLTITNGVLYLNGAPVKFAGVCDHDSSATNGSAVGAAFWRSEILMMKAANINAIRTTHYPFDAAFYDTCDELGMYVSDELPYCWCDSETPNANFTASFVQRAQETIRRDRNHPCVVIWAIGNENTAGNNLQVVANVVKALDPTRPRLVSTFNATAYGVELSDAHYPTIAQMESDAANAQSSGHPYIFLENPNTWDERLAADAGMYENWGLAMQRVWNVCEQYSTIPGTFPFEWADRAVQDPNSNASYLEYQSTGVQLLYYFPATGIHLLKMKGTVDAFRDERPNVYELQMIYSPVQVSNVLTVSSGQVSFPVQNRYCFTDLSYLTTAWQLERGGQTLAAGGTNASLPPLSSGTVRLAVPANALAYADTLRLDFLHPDGNDVVTYQFALTNSFTNSQMTLNLPDGLPIPTFNLITRSNYNNPDYWTECERFPVRLTNVVLTPANAASLAQMKALTATVIGGPGGQQTLGTVQAGFTNNLFSYTLDWTGPTWDVQEVGWTFEMPANYTQFSWNRNARWTYYPVTEIGRASGTATPASTNVDATEMDIPNAFDFDSTKFGCNWASLTSAAGDGLRLTFSSQQPFDCRAGAAGGGSGYILTANQQVCPPNDISQDIVSDETLSLSSGSEVQGSFTVGSNTNFPTYGAGTLSGPITVLLPTGTGPTGNRLELSFSAGTNTSYSVWASTNLVNWAWLGAATQTNPGQYEFFDSSATNFAYRFYRLSAP
jgi:autotransporter-associated beta strand protein